MIEPVQAVATRPSCAARAVVALVAAVAVWLSLACDRIRDPVAIHQFKSSAGSGGEATSSAGAGGAGARPSDDGEFVTSVELIYWTFEIEADYSGPDDAILSSQTCDPLANVPAGFADRLCMIGSGRLVDGSVVNLDGPCTCGYPCPRTDATVCFVLLDPAQFPWGVGSVNTPIVPLRSLTVDQSIIAHGTVLYTSSLDGLAIPARGGVGGFVHDGCLRADDAGYGIVGNVVALAAGPAAMSSWLETALPSGTQTWDLYQSAPHCAYLASP